MFKIFDFGASAALPAETCRPTDYPPYEPYLTCGCGIKFVSEDALVNHRFYTKHFGPSTNEDLDYNVWDDEGVQHSIHDEEIHAARRHSLWVERALDYDLPTFDRHNGAFAYTR